MITQISFFTFQTLLGAGILYKTKCSSLVHTYANICKYGNEKQCNQHDLGACNVLECVESYFDVTADEFFE